MTTLTLEEFKSYNRNGEFGYYNEETKEADFQTLTRLADCVRDKPGLISNGWTLTYMSLGKRVSIHVTLDSDDEVVIGSVIIVVGDKERMYMNLTSATYQRLRRFWTITPDKSRGLTTYGKNNNSALYLFDW